MNAFVGLLLSIPDVIWSGVIASAITLSGVLILDRSNTKRLQIQLKHDAAENATERNSTLRREVYLLAAEELTKVNTYLATLSQIDLTKTNAGDGLKGFFAAAAKLQLVAEPKTAVLVNQLVASYGELGMKLMGRLMPLQQSRSDISISDDLYNKSQVEVTRVLGQMATFNETASVNPLIFGALQRAFDGYQEQSTKHAADRSAAHKQFNHLYLEFSKLLIADLRIAGEQQIPVLVEIRRDLGLTSNLDEYRDQMKTQWNSMSALLDSIFSALEEGQTKA
jgi:hypothetical protein